MFYDIILKTSIKYFIAQVNKIVSSTPSKNNSQPTTAAAIVAQSSISGSAAGISSSIVGNGPPTTAAIGHNSTVQPHGSTPGLTVINSTASSNASTTSCLTNSTVQGSTVIPAAPAIAFAAVAKNNTCKRVALS